MADDSKTEKPTAKRRGDERKKGNVPISRDVSSVLTLLGSVVMLRLTFRRSVDYISDFWTYCFGFISMETAESAITRDRVSGPSSPVGSRLEAI